MNLVSAIVWISIGAILAHIAYDYFTVERRCAGRGAYEKFSDLQKSVLRIFLPFLAFILLPIFLLWKGDIFEYTQDIQMLFNLFFVALISGPAIVYACFGNYHAAVSGILFRGLLLLALLYGWWYCI